MQVDCFDEIIRCIDDFPLSTNFIDWLSSGSFLFSIISEINEEMRYSRQIEFKVEEHIILSGSIDLMKKSIDKRVLNGFFKEQKPIGRYISLHPESHLSKNIISKERNGDKYRIDSAICYSNAICGTCTEVFSLNSIAILYTGEHGRK